MLARRHQAKPDRIRLAIIGYGYMGHIYRKAFRELKDERQGENYYKINLEELISGVDLVAVVDPSINKEDHTELQGSGINIFKEIGALFTSGIEIDAVVIASPISTHFDIARICLEQGLSLLIEKPVCPTKVQIAQLARMARTRRLVVFPAHVERYNPVCLDAREYVKYKIMGKVRSYSLRRCSAKPERVRESLVIDKLIHDIDLVHSIFGPFKIKTVMAIRQGNEIMQIEVTTSHFKGYSGSIFSSWLVEEKERSIQVDFERGRLHGDLLKKKLKVFRSQEFSKEITGYGNNQVKDQLLD
ncbi:MAG: Gfo/Idh/MocA family oxidoreductase, partial [Spirochaetota bacterium]